MTPVGTRPFNPLTHQPLDDIVFTLTNILNESIIEVTIIHYVWYLDTGFLCNLYKFLW